MWSIWPSSHFHADSQSLQIHTSESDPIYAKNLSSADAGFLLVNLGFWRWRELSRRFDTRWKIGRNWDQIQKLRDETYLLEWLTMGAGTLPWPKITVYFGKSTFSLVSFMTYRIFYVCGSKPIPFDPSRSELSHGDPTNHNFHIKMYFLWFSHWTRIFPGS